MAVFSYRTRAVTQQESEMPKANDSGVFAVGTFTLGGSRFVASTGTTVPQPRRFFVDGEEVALLSIRDGREGKTAVFIDLPKPRVHVAKGRLMRTTPEEREDAARRGKFLLDGGREMMRKHGNEVFAQAVLVVSDRDLPGELPLRLLNSETNLAFTPVRNAATRLRRPDICAETCHEAV